MSNNSQIKIIRSSVKIDGHSLAFEHAAGLDNKTGPVWLFIHGIAVTPAFWKPLMPEDFANTAPWISVALPVHSPSQGPDGFTAADVTPELFNRLNGAVLDQVLPNRDVIVIGHSTGGFAGLCLALHRPKQVIGVISVGGFADGHWKGLEGDMQLMARKEKLGALGPTALRISSWLTTRWPWLHAKTASMFAYDRKTFLSDKPSKEALRLMRKYARTQDQDQLIAFFAGIRDVDIWQQIPKIKQPVLIVAGEFDPVIPHEQTMRLEQDLPNSRLVLYKGIGHMIMNEHRETFWRDIIAWQQQTFSKEL